jgi:hypothetical protein
MRLSIGWTLGAAVGAIVVMLFFAIVAARMVQTPASAQSPQTTESRR